ncbi:hypothetical protein D3C86_1449340 [compost metagenome]
MPGHHGGAETADQQGDDREDAGLGEDGDTDRQANADQALDHGPFRPVEAHQHTGAGIERGPEGPAGHAQRHEPHHDAAGPAATNTAQGRCAEMAIDQRVVQRDVQQ